MKSGKGSLTQSRRERRERLKSGVDSRSCKSVFFEHEVHEVSQSKSKIIITGNFQQLLVPSLILVFDLPLRVTLCTLCSKSTLL